MTIFPLESRSETVNVPGVPAVDGRGKTGRLQHVALCRGDLDGVQRRRSRSGCSVSVTAIDWGPEVMSETENVCTPASVAVNV